MMSPKTSDGFSHSYHPYPRVFSYVAKPPSAFWRRSGASQLPLSRGRYPS